MGPSTRRISACGAQLAEVRTDDLGRRNAQPRVATICREHPARHVRATEHSFHISNPRSVIDSRRCRYATYAPPTTTRARNDRRKRERGPTERAVGPPFTWDRRPGMRRRSSLFPSSSCLVGHPGSIAHTYRAEVVPPSERRRACLRPGQRGVGEAAALVELHHHHVVAGGERLADVLGGVSLVHPHVQDFHSVDVEA